MRQVIVGWVVGKAGWVVGKVGGIMDSQAYVYPARSGSDRNSLSNIPSVMYLITVLSDVQSSNLIL